MTAQEPAAAGSDGAGRRRGLAGWPIRRKLVALVAGPLLVVLVTGAYVTTQAVEQLREAQDAQKVATATLQSNRLSQALENELIRDLIFASNKPSAPNATRLGNAIAASDRAFDALFKVQRDAPRAGWDAGARV